MRSAAAVESAWNGNGGTRETARPDATESGPGGSRTGGSSTSPTPRPARPDAEAVTQSASSVLNRAGPFVPSMEPAWNGEGGDLRPYPLGRCMEDRLVLASYHASRVARGLRPRGNPRAFGVQEAVELALLVVLILATAARLAVLVQDREHELRASGPELAQCAPGPLACSCWVAPAIDVR